MFFDPQDYLEADPDRAESESEAERLRREAEQRAKLCEVTTRLAGELGYEGAKIYVAAREAKLGLGTYYKLYGSTEDCLLEAFEKCSAVLVRRVEKALGEATGPADVAEAALRGATQTLQADPNVARLLLGVIRAAGTPGREAQQRLLEDLAGLLAKQCRKGDSGDDDWTARMVLGGLSTLLARRVSGEEAGDLERVLPDLTYVALAPYLGVEEATAAMRRRQEELIRGSR
jgi:AcrR family transcriptional regulator